jgi:hypothetical protein
VICDLLLSGLWRLPKEQPLLTYQSHSTRRYVQQLFVSMLSAGPTRLHWPGHGLFKAVLASTMQTNSGMHGC